MKTKIMKRREATARKVEREGLTDKEQVKRLDNRLGKGKGAEKERNRLDKS